MLNKIKSDTKKNDTLVIRTIQLTFVTKLQIVLGFRVRHCNLKEILFLEIYSIGKFENVEILFYYQSQTLLNPLVDVKSPFAFKERIPAHIVLI